MLLDGLQYNYAWIKAFHVVSVISWMAGMFYLPRLFVYHAERAKPGTELDLTFQVMEDKLMRLIMTPAMLSTWFFGLLLVLTPGIVDWTSVWAWSKTVSVLGMTATHVWLWARVRDFAEGRNARIGRTFRLVNEIPTILMLIIVFSIIVKPWAF